MNITAIIAAVSAALSFGAAWQIQGIRIDHLKAEYANERLSIEHAGRAAIERAASAVSEAQAASALRASRDSGAAAAAAASDNRMRDALANAVRAASTDLQTCTGQVGTLSELFTSSTTAYRELAAETDQWVNSTVTLQEAWPK